MPGMLWLGFITLTCGRGVSAEDAYFVQRLSELQVTEGTLPEGFERGVASYQYRQRLSAMIPYAVLDGPGEVYAVLPGSGFRGIDGLAAGGGAEQALAARIAVRAPAGRAVSGRLYLPQPDASGMVAIRFTIPAEKGDAGNRDDFWRIVLASRLELLDRNVAGGAWFRHQAQEAARQLGRTSLSDLPDPGRRFLGRRWDNDMDDTLALVSGGRAISENLQLDRVLPAAAPAEAHVPLDSLEGITVAELDWGPLLPKSPPACDPLAGLIPDDQHAVFFPSFHALVRMVDACLKQGVPIQRAMEPVAQDALSLPRYQRQLCLPLGEADRLLGAQLVKSVALTGGDPYFRTGTDVAVLLEARNAAALREMLAARLALEAGKTPAAAPLEGQIDGVAYRAWRSPDRTVCCYLAVLGEAVAVTNSPAQLARLVRVHRGQAPDLAKLPEYLFFRHRYPCGEEETAFCVLSDNTIRRWCGPQWRIATSRRTRAAAVMSDLQAVHLQAVAEGKTDGTAIQSTYWIPLVDHYTLAAGGIASSVYGSLAFQTPISELDLQYATQEEADAYRRWRDGYQSYWSTFFDPIAIRLRVDDQRVAADLTVMPLITATDYRTMIEIAGGTKLDPQAGDLHPGAVVHGVLAINHESDMVRQGDAALGAIAPQVNVRPLSWLGDAVAVYLDDDPFWRELAAAEEAERFLEKNFARLPLAVHFHVRNGLKLTAFLAGVRTFLEQSAPGMTVWEVKQHKEQPYVRIAPSAQAVADQENLKNFAIHYCATGEALIVSINEEVLKRAIDRLLVRRAAREKGTAPAPAGTPWLGDSFGLQVDGRLLPLLSGAMGDAYQHAMQGRSWSNLPILNQWKQRFPNADPVTMHEQLWHQRLVCPGDGEYRWNDQWQTMESTVYGHPGDPRRGPAVPAALRDLALGNFGLSFEEHGLRARAELSRAPASPEARAAETTLAP